MTASLARLWAVGRMTLLEAVRRKVFFILLIFGAALLSATLFFPAVNDEARLRLLQAWSLRAATLFSAIVGLFLAGFSIPADIEQKRVYLLVAKPLPKPFIFLGRLLGFAMLLAIFIAATGLMSTVFMRAVSALGGPGFPRPLARPRLRPVEFGALSGQKFEGLPGFTVFHGGNAMLLWRFENLRPEDFDGPLRAQIRLFVGSPTDRYRAEGKARLMAKGPGGSRELPALQLNTNEEKDFEIPADLLGSGGRLEVGALAGDADGMIAGDGPRLAIFGRPMLFELAFLGGMGLVFLQSLTVLSLTLAASTVVSGPLSVLLGILLYLIGSIHGFMREGTRDLERSLELDPEGHRTGTVRDLPSPIIRASNLISKAVLKAVPDFDRFDYGRWLLRDTAVSWSEAGAAVAHALPVILACMLLGVARMRWRDLGG
ncbi:MAG TPA: hypothetical protein VF950_13545 [Planctomycetota bacterium]